MSLYIKLVQILKGRNYFGVNGVDQGRFFPEGSVVSVLTGEGLEKLLDYGVPSGGIHSGEFVNVELGKRNVEGLVWDVGKSGINPTRIKTLTRLPNRLIIDFNTRLFLERMAKYNLTSLNSIFKLTGWRNFIKDKQKVSFSYYLSSPPSRDDNIKLSKQAWKVLQYLDRKEKENGDKTIKNIQTATQVSVSVIKTLERKGFIKKKVSREQNLSTGFSLNYRPNLTCEQKSASDRLKEITKFNSFSTTLLRGVTGSGKTEVLLDIVSEYVAKNTQVLILVPEIGLSSGFISRTIKALGIAPVEWNSAITNSKKAEIFQSLISDDRIKVVVGARSALFLPFKKLGLIIIDEEHDISFKQQDGVRFHARDMAVLRAHCQNISVILSSATPSLETVLNCKKGKYSKVDLLHRFSKEAKVDKLVIDMRNEELEKNKSISPKLRELIEGSLCQNGQVLLFLNRRGYAPLVVCKACGDQLSCNYCDTKLVEHRELKCRLCHQCGSAFPLANYCENCGAVEQFKLLGLGVEKLFEECSEIFPKKMIKIISSDQLKSKGSLNESLLQIERGEIDIAIGTQILAKGHNFPHLALVGIIDGDLGFNSVDLRGAEKTFQIMQQVSGRVGRFKKSGIVAIQSWRPENEIIKAILEGDDEKFWDQELKNRKRANVPPYSQFIAMILEGNELKSLLVCGQKIYNAFSKLSKFEIQVFGPAIAPISKIRGKIRVRMLIQCPKNTITKKFFQDTLDGIKVPKSQNIIVDVDPQNFL